MDRHTGNRLLIEVDLAVIVEVDPDEAREAGGNRLSDGVGPFIVGADQAPFGGVEDVAAGGTKVVDRDTLDEIDLIVILREGDGQGVRARSVRPADLLVDGLLAGDVGVKGGARGIVDNEGDVSGVCSADREVNGYRIALLGLAAKVRDSLGAVNGVRDIRDRPDALLIVVEVETRSTRRVGEVDRVVVRKIRICVTGGAKP